MKALIIHGLIHSLHPDDAFTPEQIAAMPTWNNGNPAPDALVQVPVEWEKYINTSFTWTEAGGLQEPFPGYVLDRVKADKLAELADAFSAAEATGHVVSSLGFEIDATERANRDVGGLIVSMSQPGAPASTLFCDHYNEMRSVTLADLNVMQQEIIAHGQALYARKWELRTAIEAAESVADALAVRVVFEV